MFCVITAGALPIRWRLASARCPRPGRAAEKCASIAKRRRHASLRISWLARKSSNWIGLFLDQIPPGERKSGMPHSVEIPAPVNGATTRAAATRSCSLSMAVSSSGALIYASLSFSLVPLFSPGDAKRSQHEISAHHAASAQSGSGARLLLQQARPQGGTPPRRRQEPLHARVPGGAGG